MIQNGYLTALGRRKEIPRRRLGASPGINSRGGLDVIRRKKIADSVSPALIYAQTH